MSPHSPSPASGQRYQASILRHAKRDPGELVAGHAIGLLISLLSIVVLTAFLTQRYLAVKAWKKIPFVIWTVFAILIDSWAFALATIILQHGTGLSPSDWKACSAAIVLCLILYVTTKSICLFLTERAFIVRDGSKRRLESKLYLFNSAGLLCTYLAVFTLNLVHRISRLENGRCIIGARKSALVPLVSCDVLVNIYLTTLFLIPLRNLNASAATSSIVNLSFLMALNGEASWLCFLAFLFSAMVIQWVTRCDDVNGACTSCTSCSSDHHRPDFQSGRCCSVSESGPYDAASAAARRSSCTTAAWCCRRPSDGYTTRAASLTMRRDSLASMHNGKQQPPPPLLASYHNNNSGSSDYHSAVASAGPIHWDNMFSLFSHEDRPDKQPPPGENVSPRTLEAATSVDEVGGGGAPVVVATTHTTATTGATETTPLQRPKPSRAVSSIHSIRSVGMGDESGQTEQDQSPGEEGCCQGNRR
ncbi:hypothetical protein PG995_015231 [Apiospora arundinis]